MSLRSSEVSEVTEAAEAGLRLASTGPETFFILFGLNSFLLFSASSSVSPIKNKILNQQLKESGITGMY